MAGRGKAKERRDNLATRRVELEMHELARLDRFEDSDQVSPQIQAAVLQMAENRRGRTDAMMWQVPALALTAEAFLLSISLAPDSRGLARMLASAAGMLVVGASLQLMYKHRYHEILYAEWLHQVEDRRNLPRLHSPLAAEALAFGGDGHCWNRDGNWLHGLRRRAVAEQSSVRLWRGALLGLLTIDLCVFVLGGLITIGVCNPL